MLGTQLSLENPLAEQEYKVESESFSKIFMSLSEAMSNISELRWDVSVEVTFLEMLRRLDNVEDKVTEDFSFDVEDFKVELTTIPEASLVAHWATNWVST